MITREQITKLLLQEAYILEEGRAHEQRQVNRLNETIQKAGGSVNVLVDDIIFKGITSADLVGGQLKADIKLDGINPIFIQHKDAKSHQQMAGVIRDHYISKHPETCKFFEAVRKELSKTKGEAQSGFNFWAPVKDKELAAYATYGATGALKSFPQDGSAVQIYCAGELDLVPVEGKKKLYELTTSSALYIYPEIPSGDSKPIFGATYRGGRPAIDPCTGDRLVGVRLGIYPTSYKWGSVSESPSSLI